MPATGQPKGLPTSRTKTSGASFRGIQGIHLDPFDIRDRDDGKLADSLATSEDHRLGAMIDQQDAHLTTVTGVDQPRPIHHAHPVPCGMT